MASPWVLLARQTPTKERDPQGNRILIQRGDRVPKSGRNELKENELRDLETLFAKVEDPRTERTKRHRLRDIIILAICGTIRRAEGWVEIEEFEACFLQWVQGIN